MPHPFAGDVHELDLSQYRALCVSWLCKVLIAHKKRGVMLAREILEQLDQGELTDGAYRRLSRWVGPDRKEPEARPAAVLLSLFLFGRIIPRQD